jgi:hypothetical protein
MSVVRTRVTTLQFTLHRKSLFLTKKNPSCLPSPLTILTWLQLTSHGQERESWWASPCPCTSSRKSGKGSSGLWPKMISLGHSGGCYNDSKSMFVSGMNMLKNVGKYILYNLYSFCLLGPLHFDFDFTSYSRNCVMLMDYFFRDPEFLLFDDHI